MNVDYYKKMWMSARNSVFVVNENVRLTYKRLVDIIKFR